jgi:O-antigen/teichoic acid export membrane protein
MHIGKAIAGNLLAGSLGRIIGSLTPLILVPFMIRSWGLHQYGEWLILTAIPTYMMLSPDFGLAGAVVNQMAISTAAGNRQEAIYLYRTSWIFLTIMGVLFALAGIGVGMWVNWKPLGVTLLSAHAAAILSWSCIQIFLSQQMYLIGAVYRCARRNPRAGFLGSIGGVFYLAVALVALLFKGDPLLYIAVSTLARAAFLCVVLFDARRIMPDFTFSFEGVSFRAVRPYVVPGLGQATMPLVNALQNEGMVLVLGVILGPVSVAVFQTTRTAVNGAKSLIGLTASAVVLEIPALVGEGRIDSVRRLLVLNTQTALLAAFGWLLLMGIFGKTIFQLWLHNRTVYSASLVFLMLTSIIPFAIANSFSILLLATNRIHRAVVLLLPTGLISLGVTAAGARILGLNGAAMGMIVFEIFSLLVVCWVAAKHTQVGVRETLLASISRKSLSTSYKSALSALRLTRAEIL